jgi:hypothetical protein
MLFGWRVRLLWAFRTATRQQMLSWVSSLLLLLLLLPLPVVCVGAQVAAGVQLLGRRLQG